MSAACNGGWRGTAYDTVLVGTQSNRGNTMCPRLSPTTKTVWKQSHSRQLKGSGAIAVPMPDATSHNERTDLELADNVRGHLVQLAR